METISIVGTSDLHGHVENLPLFKGYINNLALSHEGRQVREYLLLDAGDMFTGTTWCNETQGLNMIHLYNKLGYHAVAPGNHEFDYGIKPLELAMRLARFPFLCSNIKLKENREYPYKYGFEQDKIVNIKNLRIGIVGGITQETPNCTANKEVRELFDFGELAISLQERIDLLRSKDVNAVVVLVHKGVPMRTPAKKLAKLATMLRGVDVIIGGHTHGVFHGFMNKIAVIQSYSLGRYFGRVDLTFDFWGKVDMSKTIIHRPQPIIEGVYEGRPVVEDQMIRSSLCSEDSEQVTTAPVTYEHYLDERGELDYLIAHLFSIGTQKEYGRDVVAIINKGAIRAPIKQGIVKEEDLFSAMPFKNTVGLSVIKGYQLKKLIENDEKGDLIISGVTQGELQTNDSSKEYLVVLSNFLEHELGVNWIHIKNLEHNQVELIKTGAKLFKTLPRILESFV